MHLAIDTSTNIASLALFKNGKISASKSWCCEQNHTVEILPALEEMLCGLSASIKDIDSISVAIGPGSFNGVRVGLSTARGLALGLGIPVASINTLKASAFAHKEQALQICPILNAGRGDVAWGLYKFADGQPHAIIENQASKTRELAKHVKEETLFCGEYLPEVRDEIADILGKKAIFCEDEGRLNRAVSIGLLGMQKIENKNHTDISSLQPIYLRKPSITKPKKVVKLKLEQKAVIWDMDGVIADSASTHLKAWQEVFSKRGITYTKKEFEETFGQKNDVIIGGKLGTKATPGAIEEIAEDKEKTFRKLLLENGVKTFPGVLELMQELKKRVLRWL